MVLLGPIEPQEYSCQEVLGTLAEERHECEAPSIRQGSYCCLEEQALPNRTSRQGHEQRRPGQGHEEDQQEHWWYGQGLRSSGPQSYSEETCRRHCPCSEVGKEGRACQGGEVKWSINKMSLGNWLDYIVLRFETQKLKELPLYSYKILYPVLESPMFGARDIINFLCFIFVYFSLLLEWEDCKLVVSFQCILSILANFYVEILTVNNKNLYIVFLSKEQNFCFIHVRSKTKTRAIFKTNLHRAKTGTKNRFDRT